MNQFIDDTEFALGEFKDVLSKDKFLKLLEDLEFMIVTFYDELDEDNEEEV
ncbi:MAG: hypothetical protein WCE94_15700 [Candidatus Methanoperedens sp.]